MIPVNRRQRTKAFFNFLMFFVITIGIVITSVFFSFQVPLKENDKLRQQLDTVEAEKVSLQAFQMIMQETTNLLDSVNQAANPFRIENRIQNNIKLMTAKVDDAPTSLKGIFNQIIDNMTNLETAKQQVRSANTNTVDLEKKDQQIRDIQQRLDQCQGLLLQVNKPTK